MYDGGWYRWERKYRGGIISLTPWIPETAMENENRSIRRISVAPSPELAFLALRNCAPESPAELYLYRLISTVPVHRVGRLMVPDAHRTGERWILREAEFRKVDFQQRSCCP